PGERLDRSMAVGILNKLLCAPGGILNTSSIGQDLVLDRRTIERYVSVFLRRFLINYLPNIKTAPNRQTFTRAKIHPVDTSLSV
ncbi:ATP-binding protein, partial [Gardnerella leopoldii]|nr:ATP-binding protein [Gardnerella leopoldii]